MRRFRTKEPSVIPPAANIPCAAHAPDLGPDTNSLKHKHDELVNQRIEMF
jgi:hypothetical protein